MNSITYPYRGNEANRSTAKKENQRTNAAIAWAFTVLTRVGVCAVSRAKRLCFKNQTAI